MLVLIILALLQIKKNVCVFCALSKAVIAWLYLFHSGDVFICIFCFKCARLRHAVVTEANLFPCVIFQLYVATESHCTWVSCLHVLRVLPGTFDWTYIYLCVFTSQQFSPSLRGRCRSEGAIWCRRVWKKKMKKKLLLDHKSFLICIDFDRIALCCKFSACEAAVMESSTFSIV